MKADAFYVGIDLGGTNIKAGLVSPAGKVHAEEKIPTDISADPVAVLKQICDLIKALAGHVPEGGVIRAAGVGAPGQVNSTEGIFYEGPNLPLWKNVPVVQQIQESVKLYAALDNDANLAALGEYAFGAGQGVTEMMMVTLGTGVGSGLILNGRLYHGGMDSAGEFGHTTIRFDGPVCGCGRHGCVEAYVGTAGMLRTLQEKLDAGRNSVLKDRDFGSVTPRDISLAAAGGDTVALETLSEAGTCLGVGLGNAANLLNLQRVVVGGGVAGAGDLILEPARKSMMRVALKVPGETIEIVPARLGNRAGLIGAARMAMLITEMT